MIITDELKAMDIKVIGQTIPNHYFDHENLDDYKNFPIIKELKCNIPAPNVLPCNKAFFDITTLFAYVAEVTNGDCHRHFKVKTINNNIDLLLSDINNRTSFHI